MTRQRLDDQGLTQLLDVAQQVPGVHVNPTGSPGADSSPIYSRGFIVENYQVDGMRRLSSYNSVVQSNDLVVFDRAEIVRGAVGLMNGTGTPAATINLIRKRPSDEARVSLKTQVGSWDYYRMEFDAGAPLNDSGRIRGRLVSAYQENDSYVDRLSERKKILYGVLDFDISDNTRGFIGMDIQEHGVQGQMRTGFRPFFTDGTPANWSRSDSSGASWAYSDRKTQAYFFSLEHNFANGWLLKGAFDHTVLDYDDMWGWVNYEVDRDTGQVTLSNVRYKGKPELNSADIHIAGSFVLFGQIHDLALGISSVRTSGKNEDYPFTREAPLIPGWDNTIPNIFAWNGTTPERPEPTPIGNADSMERINSAYGSARFRITDSVSLIGGLRATDWENNRTATNYSSGVVTKNNRNETGEVTPFAAVIYDLNDHWTGYVSYTDIFKPQSNRNVQGTVLDPLLGRSYELGLKGEFFDQRLNFSSAVYKTKQDNYATPAIPKQFTPDGAPAWITASGVEVDGYELEINGRLSEGWQASASYSHTSAKDPDGEPLFSFVPKNMVKIFTTYKISGIGNGLTIGGGARWQSSIESSEFDWLPGSPTLKQSSYTVLDLMAQYPLSRNIKATLNIYNAFDDKYRSFNYNAYYGAPRSGRLSIDIAF